ncbi:hypothetical protein [Yinghuangia soli]|uniref:Uncharacterized protein n=1 Tax=Yinghuangia soli TaxID=2908204 RepID=A0AA41PYD1_9ACTN|nr:hypothetical protein [Yinghuangia soli]MCF2526737.1 hypothetical protein [Yinghuangia soli]
MRSRVSTAAAFAGCLLLVGAAPGTAWAAPTARSLVPYAVTGTPVHGSTAGCDDAPVLKPGLYVDGLTEGKDVYYLVQKQPEQVLDVSATAVTADNVSNSSRLGVGAGWAEGKDPKSWLSDSDSTSSVGVLSVGGRSNAKGAGQRSACIRIENRLRWLDAKKGRPVPLELVIGFGGAPAATGGDGFSFAGAKPVPASGAVQGDLTLGDYPFWRVEVKEGQSLTVRGVLTHPAGLDAGSSARWTIRVFNPTRSPARCRVDTSVSSEIFIRPGTGSTEQVCGPWEANSALPSYESDYTVPGTYYIVPGVVGVDEPRRGQVARYEMTVTVSGTPRSAPGPEAPSAGSAGTSTGAGGVGTGAGAGTGQHGTPQGVPGEGGTDPAVPVAHSGGDDSTDTLLKASAAVAALIAAAAAGAFGMHMYRRRLAPAGTGPGPGTAAMVAVPAVMRRTKTRPSGSETSEPSDASEPAAAPPTAAAATALPEPAVPSVPPPLVTPVPAPMVIPPLPTAAPPAPPAADTAAAVLPPPPAIPPPPPLPPAPGTPPGPVIPPRPTTPVPAPAAPAPAAAPDAELDDDFGPDSVWSITAFSAIAPADEAADEASEAAGNEAAADAAADPVAAPVVGSAGPRPDPQRSEPPEPGLPTWLGIEIEATPSPGPAPAPDDVAPSWRAPARPRDADAD